MNSQKDTRLVEVRTFSLHHQYQQFPSTERWELLVESDVNSRYYHVYMDAWYRTFYALV